MKTKRPPTRESAALLQRRAQERADEQGRRIPWQQLHEARERYIDWQEFSLWVRSIVEAERTMPGWLSAIVERRCRGFVQAQTPGARPLASRLEDWIDEHVFGFAMREGWYGAIAYYAIRDPRHQRAEVCWAECVKQWAQAKPIRYPSLEEWQQRAATCDESAHLIPEQRTAHASARLVDRGRLREAVTRYVDWEALVYWARPALEHGTPVPDQVKEELERRCPGFLARAFEPAQSGSETVSSSWDALVDWIADRHFSEARTEGWFDAILVGVRRHARAIRTMEYADHCDEVWGPNLPTPYPAFEDWRRDADSYVEVAPV